MVVVEVMAGGVVDGAVVGASWELWRIYQDGFARRFVRVDEKSFYIRLGKRWDV